MRDEETEHDFKEGASFDDVISRYDFDRSLRLILFDAIEIIEVALRAKIINHLSQAKKSHHTKQSRSFCPTLLFSMVKPCWKSPVSCKVRSNPSCSRLTFRVCSTT